MTNPVSERIALVAPSVEAAAILRHDLIDALTRRGHRVLCLTPPGAGKHIRILRGLGALHRVLEPPPTTLRMISDWQTIQSLIAQFKDWEPNIVVSFGLRTLVLATVAARRAGVGRAVTMVNGLPSGAIESIGRRRLGQALRDSDAVVFHNEDNRRLLTAQGLLPADVPSLVVPGSGIDLRAVPAAPLPALDAGLVFLMLARLERRRGVLEYKAAAERLKKAWPTASFRLAGPLSGQPDHVTPETLTNGGAVEYLGSLDDVYPALAACHVYVYPTHGEGMPRSVLEALATGRPVITTRTPGCATTVDEKVSGCLVPPGDSDALAVAMESYLRNPDQLAAGARAARLKAERRFSADAVNDALIRTLGLA